MKYLLIVVGIIVICLALMGGCAIMNLTKLAG